MKKINIIFSAVFLLLFSIGCSKEGIDEDTSFINSANSNNLNKIFDISNDNSGLVKITPLGEGFTRFVINYGDAGASPDTISAGEEASHNYPEGSYTVSITGYDIAGKATTTEYPLSLTYRAPENLDVSIAGDVEISASADYANGFLVYYGDVPNEVGTPLAVGATLPPHNYAPGGPYDIRVVALSGGAATTEFVKTLFGFPLDFESPTMDYFFGTFGNVVFSKVANPAPGGINTSATVGKYEKPTGAESWSGTYSPLNIPINFAHGNKVKMLVYNPVAGNIGKLVNVELESAIAGSGAPANGVAVLKVPITTSGAWEELVFDFSTNSNIPATSRFGQLVLRFNDTAAGAGETFYIDNIRLTN